MPGPLNGIRIIDMTSVGMGPMATQMLGDMGADVIKIESAEGDVFRHVTPQRHNAMSHTHLNLNRNKRSVIDAKSADGRQRLDALIGGADVFISNMRARDAPPGPGLRNTGKALSGPDLLRLLRLFGTRPYAGRAAIDDTIQAASGMAWLQGGAGAQARAT